MEKRPGEASPSPAAGPHQRQRFLDLDFLDFDLHFLDLDFFDLLPLPQEGGLGEQPLPPAP